MQDQWNERFASAEYAYGEQPNAFIEAQSHRILGKSVVAFAEGEGRNAVYLARQGLEVTAWDYADNGLRKTQELAERHRVKVKTELKDLIHDPVSPEAFDAAIMVFGHFPKASQRIVLDKMTETVKSGGTVMLEVYSEEQLQYLTGGPRSEDLLYRAEDVLHWTRGHQVVHFFYGEQRRDEGALHHGIGHVIQAVIRKR
ncbi:class I SAM-dependent methyltransferase [Paenibacillus kobensis]|uniref:class I SAM-dependent methyltransferase n=1 Tax=Paenibacillus kobensis TaxID=59841 RepID=UPI000FD7F675|nr:class I SAM-dependent methyltransferase [Paenibacillus kobensis]